MDAKREVEEALAEELDEGMPVGSFSFRPDGEDETRLDAPDGAVTVTFRDGPRQVRLVVDE